MSFKNVIAVPAAFAKIDCRNSCWDVGFCGRRHIFSPSSQQASISLFVAGAKNLSRLLPFHGIAERVAATVFGAVL